MSTVLTTILVLLALSRPLSVIATDFYPVTEADKKFLAEIVDAVRKKDSAWIAAHMVYPLSLVASNTTRIVKTKEEFAPILARELIESVRAKIVDDAKKPLFKNWRGVMVGDGILWFSGYQDNQHTSLMYGILAIGHFAVQTKEGANMIR